MINITVMTLDDIECLINLWIHNQILNKEDDRTIKDSTSLLQSKPGTAAALAVKLHI